MGIHAAPAPPSKWGEVFRRGNTITKWIAILVALVFLANLVFVVIGNADANAGSRHCPRGHDSKRVTKYWADGDPTTNWRLGEINIHAGACFGGKGKIKKSHVSLYVRRNQPAAVMGYEIYRTPGNDYVQNHKHGLYKVYHKFVEYHQCMLPLPGGGMMCNHTGRVEFMITIFSKLAMKRLRPYQPADKITWMWMPDNDWADDHFELFDTP